MKQYYLDKSKQKVISSVMEDIQKDSVFARVMQYRTALVSSLVIATVALFAILSVGPLSTIQDPPVPNNPITLSEQETTKFAEVSYLSGTLIASSFQVDSGVNMMQLNTTNQTAFESNFDEYHQYFHMLKVFLEPDYFKNNVDVLESDKEDYSTKLLFSSDGVTYTLYMNLEDEYITGELYVNDHMYNLSGTFEEEEEEFSLELHAYSGENYIDITYDSEFGSETETSYYIESMINNVYEEKEISVTHEEDESKVEMENTDSSFELKYELEDGEYIYKLSYEIDDQEGEVLITETINEFGEVVYHYEVTEGGISTELDREKPSFDEDEEDEDDEEDDEEDEEDELETVHPLNQESKKVFV